MIIIRKAAIATLMLTLIVSQTLHASDAAHRKHAKKSCKKNKNDCKKSVLSIFKQAERITELTQEINQQKNQLKIATETEAKNQQQRQLALEKKTAKQKRLSNELTTLRREAQSARSDRAADSKSRLAGIKINNKILEEKIKTLIKENKERQAKIEEDSAAPSVSGTQTRLLEGELRGLSKEQKELTLKYEADRKELMQKMRAYTALKETYITISQKLDTERGSFAHLGNEEGILDQEKQKLETKIRRLTTIENESELDQLKQKHSAKIEQQEKTINRQNETIEDFSQEKNAKLNTIKQFEEKILHDKNISKEIEQNLRTLTISNGALQTKVKKQNETLDQLTKTYQDFTKTHSTKTWADYTRESTIFLDSIGEMVAHVRTLVPLSAMEIVD